MGGAGWSCPHEENGACQKIKGMPCDPGMKGCELFARYVFFDDDKNTRINSKKNEKLTKEKEVGND